MEHKTQWNGLEPLTCKNTENLWYTKFTKKKKEMKLYVHYHCNHVKL